MRDSLGNPLFSGRPEFARGILLLEDCEGTSRWIIAGTDANVSGTFETAAAFMGLKGLLLTTGNADPAEDDLATAERVFAYPESGLLVVRCVLTSPDWSKVKAVALNVWHDDGSAAYQGAVLLAPNVPECKWYDSTQTPAVPDGWDTPVSNYGWLNLEIVVDCRAHQYLSAAYNGLRVDLSGQGLYTPGGGDTRGGWVVLAVYAAGAAPAVCYFDNLYAGEYKDV